MKLNFKIIGNIFHKTKKTFSLRFFIIFGIIIGLFAGGYFGYTKLQSYQDRQTKKERQAQELIKAQQETLEELKSEIQKEKEESSSKISNLQQQLNTEKNKPEDLTIQASEIESYLTGVQEITCYGSGSNWSKGSGSLWFLNQKYLILTNKHVIAFEKCEMDYENKDRKTIGFYGLDTLKMYSENPETDSTFVPIEIDPSINPHIESALLSTLNYKISSLRKCGYKMPIGAPVVLIGYPVYGRKIVDDSGGYIQYKITTNGIISGYDDFLSGKYANYFVSAKIDSGNSGGIAFSKDSNGLCLLGIPTWLTVGNYETQGIVQNINNIFK